MVGRASRPVTRDTVSDASGARARADARGAASRSPACGRLADPRVARRGVTRAETPLSVTRLDPCITHVEKQNFAHFTVAQDQSNITLCLSKGRASGRGHGSGVGSGSSLPHGDGAHLAAGRPGGAHPVRDAALAHAHHYARICGEAANVHIQRRRTLALAIRQAYIGSPPPLVSAAPGSPEVKTAIDPDAVRLRFLAPSGCG